MNQEKKGKSLFETKSAIYLCPKCGENSFEIGMLPLKNDAYMPVVIKCGECNTVIGCAPAAEVIEHRKNFP